MRHLFASLACIALCACGQSHGPTGDAGVDSGSLPPPGECGACPRPCCTVDPGTGRSVAPFCPGPMVECEGPPPPPCEPPACPAPPAGCRYVGGDMCFCGELACDPDPMACEFASDPRRECMVDFNCFVGFVQTDCCGTRVALGVGDLVGYRDEWEAAAMQCAAGMPECDCPAMVTTTDTGQAAPDPGAIAVRCASGGCETYVP